MKNDLKIYDTVANQWWSDTIPWVRTLKSMVPGRMQWFDQFTSWQGKTVLDLECAGGFMSEALAKRGAIVSGIDPASEAIQAAKDHAQQDSMNIAYTVGVGENLPYPDAQFDIVVCVDVLEHVQDLPKVLAEVFRVLKPGGLFLYDTINKNPLAAFVVTTVAETILRLLPKGTHDPALFINPKTLAKTMTNAGLIPGPSTGLGPTGLTFKNKTLGLRFGKHPFRWILYIGMARKPNHPNFPTQS